MAHRGGGASGGSSSGSQQQQQQQQRTPAKLLRPPLSGAAPTLSSAKAQAQPHRNPLSPLNLLGGLTRPRLKVAGPPKGAADTAPGLQQNSNGGRIAASSTPEPASAVKEAQLPVYDGTAAPAQLQAAPKSARSNSHKQQHLAQHSTGGRRLSASTGHGRQAATRNRGGPQHPRAAACTKGALLVNSAAAAAAPALAATAVSGIDRGTDRTSREEGQPPLKEADKNDAPHLVVIPETEDEAADDDLRDLTTVLGASAARQQGDAAVAGGKPQLQSSEEICKYLQDLAKEAEVLLPQEEGKRGGGGAKARAKLKKEHTLMEALRKSWEGKTYYERLQMQYSSLENGQPTKNPLNPITFTKVAEVKSPGGSPPAKQKVQKRTSLSSKDLVSKHSCISSELAAVDAGKAPKRRRVARPRGTSSAHEVAPGASTEPCTEGTGRQCEALDAARVRSNKAGIRNRRNTMSAEDGNSGAPAFHTPNISSKLAIKEDTGRTLTRQSDKRTDQKLFTQYQIKCEELAANISVLKEKEDQITRLKQDLGASTKREQQLQKQWQAEVDKNATADRTNQRLDTEKATLYEQVKGLQQELKVQKQKIQLANKHRDSLRSRLQNFRAARAREDRVLEAMEQDLGVD